MKLKKKIIRIIAILFTAIILFTFVVEKIKSNGSSDNTTATSSIFSTLNDKEKASVTRVKDGDTIVVNIGGTEKTVRLIGVDTPESVSSDEEKNCEEGKIASKFTEEQLTGKTVYLEYDEGKTDKYGRTLAYVYLENNEMYNETLLKKGYARTMTIAPNTKYAKKFEKLEAAAKKNGTSFWGSSTIWS